MTDWFMGDEVIERHGIPTDQPRLTPTKLGEVPW